MFVYMYIYESKLYGPYSCIVTMFRPLNVAFAALCYVVAVCSSPVPAPHLYYYFDGEVSISHEGLLPLLFGLGNTSSNNKCAETVTNAPIDGCDLYASTRYWPANGGKELYKCDVIFEDNFDGNSLDRNKWAVESTLPEYKEKEFVSYQESAISVDKGLLTVSLKQLTDDEELRNGSLHIQGCTTNRCWAHASANEYILPPYVSGRITTKQSFSFTYGKVEIRAKLPVGDWIYPQLYLRPQTDRDYYYYASGEMKIAMARGNRNMKDGNSVLYGGVVLNYVHFCPRSGLMQVVNNNSGWGDAFHVYGLEWTEDEIKMSVDGEVYGTVNSKNKYSKLCTEERGKHWKDTDMKPFDDKFSVSIGLAVGGWSEFVDNVGNKPWGDWDKYPMINFWNKKATWHKTWGKNSKLLIDYVRVTAL